MAASLATNTVADVLLIVTYQDRLTDNAGEVVPDSPFWEIAIARIIHSGGRDFGRFKYPAAGLGY